MNCAAFDFETKNSYSIRVRSTDSGGLYIEKDFAIAVIDVNESASTISLSNNILAENEPAPQFVGTLSTNDPDAGDVVTYRLVAGSGSGDNSLFRVTGNTLEAIVSLDFEARSFYSVRIRATDIAGLNIERSFVILATNVNEAPQAIQITNTQIFENQPTGTIVGSLSATDPENNVIQYALVGGDGSDDNHRFTIVGQQLLAAESFDFETNKRMAIRVRATDTGGLSVDRNIVVGTLNVNENPTLLELSNDTVDEFRPMGTAVARFRQPIRMLVIVLPILCSEPPRFRITCNSALSVTRYVRRVSLTLSRRPSTWFRFARPTWEVCPIPSR